MTWRRWLGMGALMAGLSVAFGAFAAHGLRARVSADDLAIFETGARYQMYHGLALIGVALAGERGVAGWRVVAWLFVCGIVLFSGSLYLLALTGVTLWGVVTPFGGVAFLIGWGVLVWRVFRLSPS